MALYVILGLAGLAFLVIRLLSSAPATAVTLIEIKPGGIQLAKGRIKPSAREMVQEILTQSGVKDGFIAVSSGNHVSFSRHVPETVHQRLRNVLLNQ